MPVLRNYELVPCKQVGILIRYIKNRVVVAAIQPDSVAAEYVSSHHRNDILKYSPSSE